MARHGNDQCIRPISGEDDFHQPFKQILIRLKFFLRTADSDVHRYLKLFTFEPLEVLETIMEEHNKVPHERIAQHKLAGEVLKIVHGDKVAKVAEQEHRGLFGRKDQSTDSAEKAVPLDPPPTHSLVLPKSLVYGQRMTRVLYHAGLAPSHSEAHRMVTKKGVYLGARPGGTGTMGEQVDYSPVANWEGKETEKYILDDTLIIRLGKWKIKIIKIISDEEFERKGLSAPGWKDDKPAERLTDDLRRMKPWHKKSYIKNAPIHQKAL